MLLSLLVPLAILPFSLAAKHTVQVSDAKDTLIFTPNNVTAAVKDTIEFSFYPHNHSVAESDYSSPCQAKTGGIFSGFFVVPQGVGEQIFTVTVNDTKPRWLYCSQETHCQGGMVMVINPPQSGDNLKAYTDAAAKAQGITSQDHVEGGVVSNSTNTSSGSSSAASAAATGSTTSSATSQSTHSSSRTSTATGTGATATHTGGAGTAGAGAGLGALGLLSFLVGGMI